MNRYKAMSAIALGFALAASALAKPPKAIVEAVRVRAVEAGFDGAILIGEKDGSYAILTSGEKPVAPNAVWRWASITKQLAATLVMQEVAAGTLDLDAPVSRYWPEWKSGNAASIRLRDLMLHNSGLPQPDASTADAQGVPAFYRSAAAPPQTSAGEFCAGIPRVKAPAEFDYNNCDAIVLAQILAITTGHSFETLVR